MVKLKIYTAWRSKDSLDNLFDIYRNIKNQIQRYLSLPLAYLYQIKGENKLALYTGDKEEFSPF